MVKSRYRTYGIPPYRAAVVHGGPGAAGSMEPVARELSSKTAVVEPIQHGLSVDSQVDELKEVLTETCSGPVVLIGASWGAWLACLCAARNPSLVAKLILVGSGPFESTYVDQLKRTRHDRLSPEERDEHAALIKELSSQTGAPDPAALSRLGALSQKTDDYQPMNPLPHTTPSGQLTDNPVKIFSSVWPQADTLRASGKLLEETATIRCPVVAIHGTFDPHPAAGVSEPLSRVLTDFTMITIEHCGHSPWNEQLASERFFSILEEHIG